MENAVEALYMAFGVMVFVLALSVGISSFNQARITVDAVVANMEEDQNFVKDSSGKYINYIHFDDSVTRTVGIDTILPTMYKSYVENFEIRFYNIEPTEASGLPSATEEDETGTEITYYYIDSERELHPNETAAYEYLDSKLKNGFYAFLSDNNNEFIEKLGEYYQEDKNNPNNQIAEVNKHKKRVIVYIKQ